MKLHGKYGGQRGKSLDGLVMVDTWRGRLRVRKWPRKRKPKLSEVTLDQMDWFRQAQLLNQFQIPEAQQTARDLTANTALYPRDVLTMAMAGRLATIVDDRGREWIPMAARRDASRALDFLTTEPGAILVRQDELWGGLLPGQPGSVLTAGEPGQPPTWQPVGQGFSIIPPDPAQFTEARTRNGMFMDPIPGAQSDPGIRITGPRGSPREYGVIATAAPAGDFTVTANITPSLNSTNSFWWQGIAAMDQDDERAVFSAIIMNTSQVSTYTAVSNSLTSFDQQDGNTGRIEAFNTGAAGIRGNIWFRLLRSGNNLHALYSTNRFTFIELAVWDIATIFPNGLGWIGYFAGDVVSGGDQLFLSQHWSVTTP